MGKLIIYYHEPGNKEQRSTRLKPDSFKTSSVDSANKILSKRTNVYAALFEDKRKNIKEQLV